MFTYGEVPMHVCNETDFAKFHPPSKASQGLVNRYIDTGGFMCLDMRDVPLFGADPANNTATMDIMFLPCGMKESLLGHHIDISPDRIPDDCNFDRDEMLKYLGSLQMIIWSNSASFQLDAYGAESITKESQVTRIQIDEYRPSWINTKISSNLVSDETQFI